MCDAEEANRPKWLIELENRKRKPRLAHEAGAGAPCMVCSAACPGLDLHFWRKICKNCKCSRDDHDVDDDEFPQFDLLFGPSKKFKKKPILLRVNTEKPHEGETAFEWVPPDTTKELATDYMKALPVEKLPIKGSAGAALRRQLLQKQLPLHDVDHKACDELSEQEQRQFEKYLENIKKYVGQGKVTKILSARPFDRALMTPANATDMRFSPKHKPSIAPSTIQLRTPSSFATKLPYAKNLYENQNKQNCGGSESENNQNNSESVPEKYNVVSTCSSETARSEPVRSGVYNSHPTNSPKFADNQIAAPEESSYQNPAVPAQGFNVAFSENADIVQSILADAFLPPSTVHAHDIIGSTLDESRLMFIREKLTDKYSNQENQVHNASPNVARDLDASDLLHRGAASRNATLPTETERSAIIAAMKNPAGTLAEEAVNAADCEPANACREIMRPPSTISRSTPLELPAIAGNLREKSAQSKEGAYPLLQITETSDRPQAPVPAKCESQVAPEASQESNLPAKLSSSTVPSNIIFSEKLNNQIFPHDVIGTSNQRVQNLPNVEHLKGAMEELTIDSVKSQKCNKCEEEIRIGDVAVVTEKAKNGSWHPGCFVCSMCNELLVDLVYFHYKNKLYCGRDLATLLGIPRCFACDELIFVHEYTVAEGHNYHVKHFCCWDCDVPLAGQKYITENDRPLCLPCYQKTYAKTCNACKNVIAADQQGVAVKNLNFHATESCFCCHICKKNLLNGRMAVKEDKLFCSKECIAKFLH